MRWVTTGGTRFVILTKKYAIKIPRFDTYRSCLNGLLANDQETMFSKLDYLKGKVCPVLFYLPFGLLVVMPITEDLNEDEVSIDQLKSFCLDNAIPSEIKYSSFGWYRGQLVCRDYGT